MDAYPVTTFNTLDDVNKFANTLREYRKRDISEINNLHQVADYTAGLRKVTLTVSASSLINPKVLSYDVDATAGATTMTLPAAPLDGEEHRVFKKDVSANNVVVSGNGKNVNGGASISWNTQYQGRLLIYMGGTGEWRAATL